MSEIDDLLATARRLDAQIATDDTSYDDAAQQYATAQAAAEALQLPHWTAIKAVLTGRRKERREAAAIEVDLAARRLSEAHQRIDRTKSQREGVRVQLEQAYAEQARQVAAAQQARHEQMRAEGDPRAAEVDSCEARVTAADQQLVELYEATVAVAAASEEVRLAETRLTSAKDWGTYDTFFGGGMISSAIKHDRIDDAKAALGRVSTALERAHAELADVKLSLANPALARTDDWRTFDIWFDNFWSDWATQSRISDSLDGVRRLRADLGRMAVQLSEVRTLVQEDKAAATSRRAELLA
jgi:DNA repair exonuclease SbcCD ATPase subunit